jgi:hypothetical protein
MKDDPIVEEGREAGRKLLQKSGGTFESFCEMIREAEAKEKRPILRPPSPKGQTRK